MPRAPKIYDIVRDDGLVISSTIRKFLSEHPGTSRDGLYTVSGTLDNNGDYWRISEPPVLSNVKATKDQHDMLHNIYEQWCVTRDEYPECDEYVEHNHMLASALVARSKQGAYLSYSGRYPGKKGSKGLPYKVDIEAIAKELLEYGYYFRIVEPDKFTYSSDKAAAMAGKLKQHRRNKQNVT